MENEIKVMTSNDRITVMGRDLHEFLEVGTKYQDWIARMIERYSLIEDEDYIAIQQKVKTNNPKNPATIRTNHQLLSKKAIDLINFLIKHNSNISRGAMFQKEFEILLEKTLDGIVKINKQLTVLNYKLDFYIHKLNLAIEYDEEYHKYKKEDDKLREEEIKKELGCTFIRVKKGEELEGLNKIITLISKEFDRKNKK